MSAQAYYLTCLALLCVLTIGFFACAERSLTESGVRAQKRVLPLDPLNVKEQQVAEPTVRADLRMQELLRHGGRPRVVHLELLP